MAIRQRLYCKMRISIDEQLSSNSGEYGAVSGTNVAGNALVFLGIEKLLCMSLTYGASAAINGRHVAWRAPQTLRREQRGHEIAQWLKRRSGNTMASRSPPSMTRGQSGLWLRPELRAWS